MYICVYFIYMYACMFIYVPICVCILMYVFMYIKLGKLPAALSLLTSLQQLDLYNNYITGDIPEEYSELASLRDLYLGGNPGMQIDRAALYSILPNCKLRL